MQKQARPWIGLTAIVVGASALLALGTVQVREWVVQTDEMLYAKLARHMGTTGSPLPVLHGEHVGFLGVVYSILLAPFYGTLDPVAAYDAAHVVNAILFASTAVPVYLLGRRFLPRECALVVAALSISGPTIRLTRDRIAELAPALVEHARSLSERLGAFHRGAA